LRSGPQNNYGTSGDLAAVTRTLRRYAETQKTARERRVPPCPRRAAQRLPRGDRPGWWCPARRRAPVRARKVRRGTRCLANGAGFVCANDGRLWPLARPG